MIEARCVGTGSAHRVASLAATRCESAVDGNYYPYPPLDVDAITRVESGPDGFVIYAEPPAGMSIEARVEKAGRWIEFVRVSFAAE